MIEEIENMFDFLKRSKYIKPDKHKPYCIKITYPVGSERKNKLHSWNQDSYIYLDDELYDFNLVHLERYATIGDAKRDIDEIRSHENNSGYGKDAVFSIIEFKDIKYRRF